MHYKDAASNPNWQSAMDSEISLIHRSHTWEIVDREFHMRPITAKWIYKVKKGMPCKPKKLKARIVAHGFQQPEGIDYNKIFSLVV